MIQPVLFSETMGSHGSVGLITLNRPQALNAVNLAMITAIQAQLLAWQDTRHIQAVIIQGAGERAFCAGGDLRSLYQQRTHGAQCKYFFEQEYQLNRIIFHYRKPFIALLNGITMGGGVGLSLHGRWRIAAPNFVFAMPETRIGFFTDIGAGYFLTCLPSLIGYYLALTGNSIQATDALALGLIDAIVPSESMNALRQSLLSAHYVRNGDGTIAALLNPFRILPNRADLQLLPKAGLIEKYFAANTVEGIMANLAQANDPWCQQTLEQLQQRSPTSLKVTLKHLQHCELFGFSEVIAEDNRLAQHFFAHHDFFEGIRAIIIDKDHSPKWQPDRLANVTAADVNRFFN